MIRTLFVGIICLLAFPSLSLKAQKGTPSDPARVLVVYNRSWADGDGNGQSDSKDLAYTYRYLRGIPYTNLLGLALTTTNRKTFKGSRTVAWDRFISELVVPLRTKLQALGKTNIDTILLCYGVPHAVLTPTPASNSLQSIDDYLDQPFHRRLSPSTVHVYRFGMSNPYFHNNPTKSTDRKRFSHSRYGLSSTYMVCRLDGTSLQNAKDLITAALYNEKYGALGRGKISGNAYIDSRHGFKTDSYLSANYPNYPGVNIYARYSYMFSYSKAFPIQKGIPTFWEYSGFEVGEPGAKWSTGQPALSGPNALLYFGWYNYSQFLDVWSWVPGAVACDLDSNSIQNFHDPHRTKPSFLSSGLERGLAGASGSIAEPYINGHTRPDVMLYYLLKGRTFAEATAVADPKVAWKTVHIGDPLYTPFHTRARIKDNRPPYNYSTSTIDTGTGDILVKSLVSSWRGAPDLARFRYSTGSFPNQLTGGSYSKIYRGAGSFRFSPPKTYPDNRKAQYFAVETKDPAGNHWKRTYVYSPSAWTHVFSSVRAEKNSATRGQKVRINFAYGAMPYYWKASTRKVERYDFLHNRFIDITQTVNRGRFSWVSSTDYKLQGFSYLFDTSVIPQTSKWVFVRFTISDGTNSRSDYTWFSLK